MSEGPVNLGGVDQRPSIGEQRFRALVKASSNVVYRASADWSEIEQLDGRPVAGLDRPSATWADDFIFPSDRTAIEAVIKKAVASRSTFEMEHRVRQDDGSEGWVLSRAVPVSDRDGKVVEWFGMVTDITRRKRVEDEFRDGEARLRFLSALDESLRNAADAPAAMRAATELLARHLDATRTAYADVDEDSDRFFIRDDYSASGVPTSAGTYSLDLFGSRAAAEMRNGQTLVIRDVASELAAEDGREMFQSIQIGAIVCCPLIKEGELVAMMAVHQDRPRDWRAGEIELVQIVVDRCWAHVQRVAAEMRLRQSELRYRTLFEAIDAGFCLVEVDAGGDAQPIDYRVMEANPAFFRHTGFPPQIVGQWLREAVPDLEEHWYETYGRIARTGNAERFEQGSDALDRWFDVYAFPAGAPGGESVAILFNDISARRQAEVALRDLNETLEQRIAEEVAERKLLADLVENTDAFVQVVDLDYRWLAINRAAAREFERIYGKRPEVGENMLDVLADMPEHRAAVKAVWSRALAGEEFSEVGEFGDGGLDRRSYEMNYRTLCNPAGERIGAYQFVYDVTERVRERRRLDEAETARREADELYRAYFENSPEALFVICVGGDGAFIVEEVNPAHEAGVGLRLDEIRGKKVEEILPPNIAERVLASYRHVVETGSIHQYREIFDLSGAPQHWDTSLVPVRDADGDIRRIIGSSRNVTRQTIAEEALRQSQKMEAMGQLTGGVAHDFNNLLTPIVGSLDMLQRASFGGGREQRLIAGAMQSAERAKTLVQRLLAFARRQPLQPVPVDVGALISGMSGLVSSTTGPQIRLLVDVAPDLGPALADPNQLEMALLNLAVNARDAMPDGGELTISASNQEVDAAAGGDLKPGRYVRLSVADTGIGMDENTRSRAIEPFFSTKGIGRGTGLGLSMVHGLASQLGGELTIQSRRGHGTTVELWLPRTQQAPAFRELEGELMEPGGMRGTALLVDDEDLVRISTADMLADLGYTVVEAASAEASLALMAEGTAFDLLVTDHLMPGMTGVDLAREVQCMRPGIPILIISGYAESEGLEADLPRLTKPFRKDELARSLSRIWTDGAEEPSGEEVATDRFGPDA